MVTYHQIQDLLEKVDLLAGQIGVMRECMQSVIRISEQIGDLNSEMMLDRETISSEMQSMRVLEDILKKHVFLQGGVKTVPSRRGKGACPIPTTTKSSYVSSLD